MLICLNRFVVTFFPFLVNVPWRPAETRVGWSRRFIPQTMEAFYRAPRCACPFHFTTRDHSLRTHVDHYRACTDVGDTSQTGLCARYNWLLIIFTKQASRVLKSNVDKHGRQPSPIQILESLEFVGEEIVRVITQLLPNI